MRAIDVHCHPSTKEHHLTSGIYMAELERMLGRKPDEPPAMKLDHPQH